jgi:aerobic-type carbon monoxide dehydrogenase small subunit (CoxS/CutS family)
VSNENNPHGLPPEFQELPEGFEPDRRGDRYDGQDQRDPYGRQHGQGGPYEQHGHGESYGQHGDGEPYAQRGDAESYEQYEQGESYGQYEQGQPYGRSEHGEAYGRHEPPQGSYGDSYGSYGDQGGGWHPTPQGGEYDGEATAFFQLPPEFTTSDAAPLEAPGHGYVPPMIRPLTPAAGTDPTAASGWATPWPEPAGQGAAGESDANANTNVNVNETGQWVFHESQDVHEATHNAHDVRDAQGAQRFRDAHDAQDVPNAHDAREAYEVRESGMFGESQAFQGAREAQGPQAAPQFPQFSEFAEAQESEPASAYDSDSGEFPLPPDADAPWAGTTPSATLPGGARAPWATLPGGASAPWAADESQRAEDPAGSGSEPVAAEPAAEEDAAAAEPVEPAEPAATVQVPGGTAAEAGVEPESPSEVESRSGSEPEPEPAAGSQADAGADAGADAVPADPAPAAAAEPPAGTEEHPPTSYVLRVNGTDRPVSDAWIGESLLYVLRERLGLAGAKDGCSQGECGACNVQVDGRLVASCLVPAATAAGSEVRTVEGLATDGEPSDVQRALAACGAVQCGFCIPGMAMTVHDLLEGNHAPTELETRQALCGNLCRCSGYRGVLDAVREVVAERAASATAAAEETEAGDEARIPHQAAPGAGSVQIHPHDGGMA